MKRRLRFAKLFWVLLLAAWGCGGQTPPAPTPTAEAVAAPTPAAPPGWELVWHDEFDGPTLNLADWNIETGGGGWGNHEWQFYTDRPENLRLEDGFLVIEARREDYRGYRYTSARINTQYKRTFAYGRIEARMKIPIVHGLWPAFWMLGEDFATRGWPDCGEIDILENIGERYTIYGTVHGPGYSGSRGVGTPFAAPFPVGEDFHVYAVEWAPEGIRWLVDDIPYGFVTPADVPGRWVFDHPFFIILNLAVGGDWPGYPDENTPFPQQLLVDYVRVYRDPALESRLPREVVLHVEEIRFDWEQVEAGWQMVVRVRVVDEAGQPVPGVTVVAGWLGVTSEATPEAVTDADGWAGPFVGRKVSSASEATFCVTRLEREGSRYDEARNRQTCVSGTP